MGIRDAALLRDHIPITEQITAVIALGYGANQPSPRADREISGSAKFF